MNIHELIRDCRRKKNLTQFELAIKIGVTRFQITNIETGYSDPSLSTLSGLINALDIPLLSLYACLKEYNPINHIETVELRKKIKEEKTKLKIKEMKKKLQLLKEMK